MSKTDPRTIAATATISAHQTRDPLISATAQAFEASYHDTQYAFVQLFSEHLADCAKAVGQDLAKVFILAVLGQRRLEYEQARSKVSGDSLPRICMSASRISDVTGYPRQTVRRKLAALKERGWIEEDPQHGWHIAGERGAAPARLALSDLEKRQFLRLARLHLRLAAILERSSD